MFVLQQRGPVISGCQFKFAQDLIEWIKEMKFIQVLILSSLTSTIRRDSEILGTQFYHKFSKEHWNQSLTNIKPFQDNIVFNEVF